MADELLLQLLLHLSLLHQHLCDIAEGGGKGGREEGREGGEEEREEGREGGGEEEREGESMSISDFHDRYGSSCFLPLDILTELGHSGDDSL